jgi:hypothetical protein
MCTTTFGTLTLAGLLSDPMILEMMRSDGVSERDHEALLLRVKDTLASRETREEPAWRPAEAWVAC